MLKSFFFIPANNLKFIDKSKDILANYIIFDLEDSILDQDINNCIANLSSVKIKPNHLVRFCFFDDFNFLRDKEFQTLLKLGFSHFIVPKFAGITQIKLIQRYLQNQKLKKAVDFILLVEQPKGLFELYQTLKSNLITINAIGFGSHDYCNAIGMQHTEQNLYFARQMVLNHARAFNINAIDTVTVNLEKEKEFIEESLCAFRMGFDGKFLIHPQQLKLLNGLKYYTDEEVEEAENVYDRILDILDQKVAIVRIDGKIYEKPHISRIVNIINWKKNGCK